MKLSTKVSWFPWQLLLLPQASKNINILAHCSKYNSTEAAAGSEVNNTVGLWFETKLVPFVDVAAVVHEDLLTV